MHFNGRNSFYIYNSSTIGGSYTFTSLPTTCVIYVPTGTLSAYTGTSNMPNKNTYTYIEEW